MSQPSQPLLHTEPRIIPISDAPSGQSAYILLALPNGLDLCLRSESMIPAARYVIDEVFVEKQYMRDGFSIRSRDVVVDIGANMGVFTLWAATQAQEGRIIAVEPIPELSGGISLSLAENSILNVQVVEKAVGSPGASIELSYYPGFNIISHRADFRRPAFARAKMYIKNFKTWSKPKRVTAESVSLGGLLDANSVDVVDFMKIDCEGGEYDIFENAISADWRRVRKLVVEFHEYHRLHDHRRLIEILAAHNFDVSVELDPITFRLMRFGTIWGKRREL